MVEGVADACRWSTFQLLRIQFVRYLTAFVVWISLSL